MPQTYYLGARSWFVTLTAWIFIVLAALACAAGAVQQATLASWGPEWQTSLNAAPLPALSGLLMAYMPWVLGAAVLMSVATLVAAAGLLMRMEWARLSFIGLMLLAIVANLAGLWLQHEYVQSLVDATLQQGALPASARGVFGGFVTAARLMAGLVTLFLCAGMGWIVRRLMSPMVRQEFVA